MEDKKQDVNVLEELSKAANDFRKWAVNFENELSKVLADIQTSKKEEYTWEMKIPYKYGDDYWVILDNGDIDSECWDEYETDGERFNVGNVFPTKEEAELEAKRRNLLTRFRAFRNECNGDWKADWKNHRDRKYFISFVEGGKLVIFNTGTINQLCLFSYFKNEQDAQRAIVLFGDEIKELFVDLRVSR